MTTETTTNTEETTNSASSETTTNETSGSNTSTTTDQSEKIDLGTGGSKETGGESDAAGTGDEPGEKIGEGEGGENEAAELFGAPEEGAAYEISGLPEGTAIDEEALKAIEPVARELNLSNAGMSKIAQVYATDVLPRVADQITSQINADVVARRSEWEGEARDLISGKGDPLKNAAGETLAFDTKELAKVQQTAAKALDKLAPEGFREWLDETGLGVHPQMIAFAYQAGLTIAEDTDVEAAERGGGTKSSSPTQVRKAGGMHKERFFDR